MIGRPKEFDRATALKGAMEAFWRHGYEATSISDLVQATGVNRASMYGTFGSKHDLFLEALCSYSTETTRRLREALEAEEGSPLGNLKRFFWNLESGLYGEEPCLGCMLINAAVELSQGDDAVSALLKKVMRQHRSIVAAALQRAAEAGEIPADAPVSKLAAFVLANLQGAVVSAKAGVPRRMVRENIELLFATLTSNTT